MNLPYNPKRLKKELIVVGGVFLLIAAGLTVMDCSTGVLARPRTIAFREVVCPSVAANGSWHVSRWYILGSKTFQLWVLGVATLLAGAALAVRDKLRMGRHSARQVIARSPVPNESAPTDFGRKQYITPGPSHYQLSPEREAALELETGVREAVARGDLDGGLALVDRAIRDCNDDALAAAASASQAADFDWITIVAAAVEADVGAKALGEEGCRDVLLELGSVDENRNLLYRQFFGPRPPQEVAWALKHGRPAREQGPVRQTIAIVGIDQLAALEWSRPGWAAEHTARPIDVAEVERKHVVSTLAGTMLVLRYLDAVRRHAAATGFPFPVTLRAGVESIGGEDSIRQHDPRLGLDLPCRVSPIGDEVAACLSRRFEVHHAAEGNANATSLRNFRAHFMTKGWVDSRFIPMSMPEFAYYRGMGINVFEPANRVSPEKFAALTERMAAVMEAERAQPIDLTPYR